MPWKETCAMDERSRFIAEWLRGEVSITELCGSFNISRKTGHKWLDRFRENGQKGLGDRSRAPKSHPKKAAQSQAYAPNPWGSGPV